MAVGPPRSLSRELLAFAIAIGAMSARHRRPVDPAVSSNA